MPEFEVQAITQSQMDSTCWHRVNKQVLGAIWCDRNTVRR